MQAHSFQSLKPSFSLPVNILILSSLLHPLHSLPTSSSFNPSPSILYPPATSHHGQIILHPLQVPCWSNATCMPFWTASFYTWNLGSIWVLLSFPEASLGVHFSREKSCRRPPQNLWNWVLLAREVGTNTWGWMSELTFQISKLHFSGCSCFFPFFPFDTEREREMRT